MTGGRSDERAGSVAWLALGLVVGAAVTAAGAMLVGSWLDAASVVEAMSPPAFATLEGAAGIDHVYDGGFEHFVGGGVAVFDCDEDDLPDIYLAGGSRPAGLFVNESEPGGELAFTRLSSDPTDLVGVTGAYPIDIDSDHLVDLVVLRIGENVVLRGTGDCRFEDANETWGIDGGDHWTVGFSASWADDDSLPTLAFGNYLRVEASGDRDECEDHFLLRPVGDTGYGAPVRLSPGYCALSVLFSDWNRSGSPDLRMTNDRHYYTDGEEQLWEMGSSPAPYGDDEGWNQLQIWGMGIASQDLDSDGLPEVFLTSQGDNKLQTLADGADTPNYQDIALAVGVTAHRPFTGDTLRPSTAWHAEFDDVNNDGFVDLFVTKGNVEDQVDFADEDPNNLLLGQADGTFVETADVAGLLDFDRSRGAAVVDLNLDGQLDVVVVERRRPVKVWRNVGDTGNWIAVSPLQPGSNRDALGAWIEVEAGNLRLTREMTVGGGHGSGEHGPIHFGLGPVNGARVRVIWPDGETGGWESLQVNRRYTWERGSGPVALPTPAD